MQRQLKAMSSERCVSCRDSSIDPPREFLQIAHIHAGECPVWTGSLAGRPSQLLHAEVTFCRLEHRLHVGPNHDGSSSIANLDHADRIVRTIIEASFAPNA